MFQLYGALIYLHNQLLASRANAKLKIIMLKNVAKKTNIPNIGRYHTGQGVTRGREFVLPVFCYRKQYTLRTPNLQLKIILVKSAVNIKNQNT